MTEQYLCAHKCRGQLAFSVCFRQGEMFITTCTGHRVYPFWFQPLSNFTFDVPEMPEGLRDMFSVNDAVKTPEPVIDEIDLEELGL